MRNNAVSIKRWFRLHELACIMGFGEIPKRDRLNLKMYVGLRAKKYNIAQRRNSEDVNCFQASPQMRELIRQFIEQYNIIP